MRVKILILPVLILVVLVSSGCVQQGDIQEKVKGLEVFQGYLKGQSLFNYTNVDVNLTLYDRDYVQRNFIKGNDVCSVALSNSLEVNKNVKNYYYVELISNNSFLIARGFVDGNLNPICSERVDEYINKSEEKPKESKANLQINIVDSNGRPIDCDYYIRVNSDGNRVLTEAVRQNPPTYTSGWIPKVNIGSKNGIIIETFPTGSGWTYLNDEKGIPPSNCTAREEVVVQSDMTYTMKVPCYTNLPIRIACPSCTENQKPLLQIFTQYQNTIFNCLKDYFNYYPQQGITYNILPNSGSPCTGIDGCFILMGSCSDEAVNGPIPGTIYRGNTEVNDTQSVYPEMHETTHVFTAAGLGFVPPWFNEGISEYADGRVICLPNHRGSGASLTYLDNSRWFLYSSEYVGSDRVYDLLKSGTITIEQCCSDVHAVGGMFFYALEKDYNCDKNCVKNILSQLHSVYLKNTRITNEIIKQTSEQVTGKDLSSLFDLLRIIPT